MYINAVMLIVPDLTAVMKEGLRHPLLGRLFDGGSYGQIQGLAPGKNALEDLLISKHELPTDTHTVLLFAPKPDAVDPTKDCISIQEEPLTLLQAAKEEEAWYQMVAQGGVLTLLIADEAKLQPALFLLYAYGLPCMGQLPPCSVDDIWHTWLRLVHGTPTKGRFLLEEPILATDQEAEKDLTERLRQLYGE